MNVVFPGYDCTTALTIAGVDTLRSRREELTRRFFTRPTRAERDILSSLLAATKARRERYGQNSEEPDFSRTVKNNYLLAFPRRGRAYVRANLES